MPSLKDFVTAMSVGWPIALAALIGSSLVLVAPEIGIPFAPVLPTWVNNILFVISAFSFSIVIAQLFVFVFMLVRNAIANRRLKSFFSQEISDLSDDERYILKYFLERNERAFTARVIDEKIAPLVERGIIIKAYGQHSVLDWPYQIHPIAWKIMKKNPKF
ncbi:hypothetical protein FF124_18185 [Martelella lutilitoris]|uniref:Superinfection exclusion protein B n=1 Tax=Martelella lutilitoris TaxID=2583532 RepID=A0A5C4JMB9_9HYPH|nr:hypothetical protein FF124_18185 [Martelella lutilitoris]